MRSYPHQTIQAMGRPWPFTDIFAAHRRARRAAPAHAKGYRSGNPHGSGCEPSISVKPYSRASSPTVSSAPVLFMMAGCRRRGASAATSHVHVAPVSPNASAIARPAPRLAPVTTATVPARSKSNAVAISASKASPQIMGGRVSHCQPRSGPVDWADSLVCAPAGRRRGFDPVGNGSHLLGGPTSQPSSP